MALGRFQDQLGQLCRDVSDTFTPVFAFPATLSFGGAGSEGSDTRFSRADHVHPLPDVTDPFDDLDTFAQVYEDFFLSSSTTRFNRTGTLAFGGRGDGDDTGGPGTVDSTTSALATGHASVWFGNSSSDDWALRLVSSQRLVSASARCALVTEQGELVSVAGAVGFIRSSATGDITGGSPGSAVTDGIFFLLDTDGSGNGNYFAKVKSAGSELGSVDMEVAPRVDGSGNVLFDTFRIDRDAVLGTTRFRILTGDGTVRADKSIESALPAPKTTGFGAFIDCKSAVARTLSVDYLYTNMKRIL